MNRMKAIRIHRHGGPEVLEYEEAPRPEPGEGEVLVRVRAAGVNPVDWKIREGYLQSALRHSLPLIPGWDLSGTVERVGPGAGRFARGDAVYARPDVARDGAYAEYTVVRASELARKPRSLGPVEAAAVPLAALTAWQALFEAPAPFTSAGLERGQTVLVHGAAGGVGTFAVQLAKWRGARVIATGSGGNEGFLRELGADDFIDYRRRRFEDSVRGVDVVLDTVGGETQERSWSVLAPGGVLVSIVSPPSPEDALAHGVRTGFVFTQSLAAQLDQIAELVDAGAVRPVIADVLPLARARMAQELSRTGHVRGKIVLDVAG